MPDNFTIKHAKVGNLMVEIYPTSQAVGEAAAQVAAQELNSLGCLNNSVGVIFATGASQLDTLRALTSIPGLPWDQVCGFHLDEYVGLSEDSPASFRNYLRKNLMQKVPIGNFFEIDGTASDLDRVCAEYASRVRSANPQLCLLGIGENGHLAFNDPEEANFSDPLDMKIVQLDVACRQQQAAEGWFGSLEEVPRQALTLTIPTILRVPRLLASVPGQRKAEIVRRTLTEAISPSCPATLLRTHPNVTLYLDQESAAELDGVVPFA